MPKFYGALPPRHDLRRIRLAKFLSTPLPAAPSASDRTGGVTAWGMVNNDREGDCTIADRFHSIMAATACATGTPIVLPDALAEQVYSTLSGYDPSTGANDNGCQIVDVLEYGRTIGFGGHKLEAWAAIDRTDPQDVMGGVHYLGGVTLGIRVPKSAEDQFDAGEPWTVPWFSPIVGQHDVPILKYDADWLYVVTWAGLQPMSWGFYHAYVDEAYVTVTRDALNAAGLDPAGLDLAGMIAAQNALGAA